MRTIEMIWVQCTKREMILEEYDDFIYDYIRIRKGRKSTVANTSTSNNIAVLY